MANFKKLIAILFLGGCSRRTVLNTCPLPVEYSNEFQKNLLDDLEKTDSFYLNQIIIDFYNINQQLRLAREKY